MSQEISAAMVMDLRKRTGVGMTKCKEALIEAKGDIEAAIHILRKKGMASAVKKGGRETNEGVVGVAENDQRAFLLEVNVETDFVVKNDRFKEFLSNICNEALTLRPSSAQEFLQMPYSKQPSTTLDEYRAEIVLSLGENIQISRLIELQKSEETSIGIYSHMGGKIVSAVVIKGSKGQEELARDIAMHVAAEAPDYLRPEEVPADVKAKEEDIARSQIKNKPPEIIEKILGGKMRAYYESSCLEEQKYVKDPSLKVGEFLEQEGKKLGKQLKMTQFIRWQIGE